MKKLTRVLSVGIIASAFAFVMLPGLALAETLLTRQLEQGMSGADVSALQSFLAKDATIYPQGLVTGYFGAWTVSAVSNFQARNGIATVGRVGPVTMNAINNQMNGDSSSPVISSVYVTPSTNGVNMSWNTNEYASAVLYYGTSSLSLTEGSATTGVTVSGSSMLVNTNLTTSHTAVLTNLFANTTYYYVIYVREGNGNESVSWPSTFKTN